VRCFLNVSSCFVLAFALPCPPPHLANAMQYAEDRLSQAHELDHLMADWAQLEAVRQQQTDENKQRQQAQRRLQQQQQRLQQQQLLRTQNKLARMSDAAGEAGVGAGAAGGAGDADAGGVPEVSLCVCVRECGW
jgi:hypothetical protein